VLNLLSTRTVFPFLTLLTISVGCGKKIQEDSKSGGFRSDQNLELSATPGVKVNSLDAHGDRYELLKDGSFILPDQLLIQTGKPATNSMVKITYNKVDEYDYEFHCLYKYGGVGSRYDFVRCENPDNRDMGVTAATLPTIRWPMDQGKTIEINFQGSKPSTEVQVQAIFSAVWK
jgi:hypothetical protein